jgi:hypothetical protein
MAADIPLDKAYLTAIWLETLFYGMNFVLFFSCLYAIRYKRKTPLNKFTLSMAIIMFLFSTVHVSLGFQRLIFGFIYLRNQPGGPAAFFSNVSIPANVAKVCIHTINSVLGDSIVVWRCYHVWGKNLAVCAFPVLLIFGSAACGFGQTYYFAIAKTTHSAFNSRLERWLVSLFSISLCTNVVVTSLVAFRIWYLIKCMNVYSEGSLHTSRYWKVVRLIIESGAIYSAALVFEITFYVLHSNAFYIVYDPIAQLTGIVPTMIIMMSTLGLTADDTKTVTSKPTLLKSLGSRGLLFRTATADSETEYGTKKASHTISDA